MIQVIDEHSIRMDLLPERANIIDAGCRGFRFSDYLSSFGHNVITIDADAEVSPTNKNNHIYRALVGRGMPGVTTMPFKIEKDRNASHITTKSDLMVDIVTIQWLHDHFKIERFDVLKLDIEGSEYDVIMNLVRPPATQISVEFHLHTGVYGIRQVKQMEDKLISLGYFPEKHDRYKAHGLMENYWDSLWIIR